MPNTCIYAPPRVHKVVVVGVKPCQFHAVNVILQGYPVEVREVCPEKLLRLRRLECLVVLTRFVNHKHSQHARRIAAHVLWVEHGAASAVADAIVSFFDLHGC